MTLRWDHRQRFDLSTNLHLDLNYASNTSVIQRNALDPLLNAQQITSSLIFSKRYRWGPLSIGGNRRQSLSDASVQQLLPALTISPASIALGSNITWSPALSFTNNTSSKIRLGSLSQVFPGGLVDTVGQLGSTRATVLDFQTPVRLGGFNWDNSLRVEDDQSTGRDSVTIINPADSSSVTTLYGGNFSTSLDWDTGINLPVLFRGSWKLQP